MDEKFLVKVFREVGRVILERGAEEEIHELGSVWRTMGVFINNFVTTEKGKSKLNVKRQGGGEINNAIQRNKAIRCLIDMRLDIEEYGPDYLMKHKDEYYLEGVEMKSLG